MLFIYYIIIKYMLYVYKFQNFMLQHFLKLNIFSILFSLYLLVTQNSDHFLYITIIYIYYYSLICLRRVSSLYLNTQLSIILYK